jgi:replicative DNA helicase
MELYNIELERAILNSIIFDNTLLDELKSNITPQDFYLPFHQAVFEAMEELYKKDLPIDEIFLKDELIKSNKFDENLFLEIISTTPLEVIDIYAHKLKQLSLKRKLTQLSTEIKKEVIAEDKDPIEIINSLKQELENLEKEDSDVFKFTDFSIIENKEVEFILQDFLPIPRGAVTLLSASGGTGKSWLVLQMLLRYINETEGKGKAFAWLSEDPLFATKKRAEKIVNEILINDKNTKFYDISHQSYQNIKFLGSETRPFHLIEYDRYEKRVNPLFFKLKNQLKKFDFIVIDPLIAFYSADENNNSQAREFMNLIVEWATTENKAILIVHHANKASSGTRGASAFIDAARLVIKLNIVKLDENTIDETNREIEITKDNWGVKKLVNGNKKIVQVFGSGIANSVSI